MKSAYDKIASGIEDAIAFSKGDASRARKVDATDERLAEALAVLRMHGANTETFIAERIGALALAGDASGIERWREIARAIDGVLRPHASA